MYTLRFTNQAEKDMELVARSNLKKNVSNLLEILEQNPYQPPYEKLKSYMDGALSRRINRQHRLVYKVFEEEKVVLIIRMWTHCE